MTLNEKIIKIRCELQNTKIKKSGYNKGQKFSYFELADFLPTLNELMLKHGVNDRIAIMNDYMILTLISGDEQQDYSIPFIIFDTPENAKNEYIKGNKVPVLDSKGDSVMSKVMQDIQYLGALNTYYKRYLYLNCMGITDGEVIDSMDKIENITGKIQLGNTQTTLYKPYIAEELPITIKTDLEMIKDKLYLQIDMKSLDMKEFAKKHSLSKESTYQNFLDAYNTIV